MREENRRYYARLLSGAGGSHKIGDVGVIEEIRQQADEALYMVRTADGFTYPYSRTQIEIVQGVQVRRLPHAEGMPLPEYATLGAAGVDLLAAVDEPLAVVPMSRALVPTGLTVALPPGFELQIRPRSGLALKHGILVANSPGTVDEDYRGQIQVIILNVSAETFNVSRGMRIAQAVLSRVDRLVWEVVDTLAETARGTGGFGSTGT